MKIAIFADRVAESGGLETHIATQINEFLKRGHNVCLVTDAVSDANLEAIAVSESFILHTPWTDDDLHGFRPDIIHAHPFYSIYRGYEASCKSGAKFFITMHGFYDFGINKSPKGYDVGKKAEKVIVVEEGKREFIAKTCSCPEKLLTIYNGIDTNIFYPKYANMSFYEEFKLNKEWKTVVIVSRFADNKEKAVMQILDCVPLIAKELNGLNMIVVGSGSHIDDVRNRNLSEINRCDRLNVVFTGNRSDVYNFLHLADVVRGCGRVALESMACRKPVYSMSGHGFGGLVDFQNYRHNITSMDGFKWISDGQIIKELVYLLTEENTLKESAEEGYSLVMEYFDSVKNTDKLESLYYKALKGE